MRTLIVGFLRGVLYGTVVGVVLVLLLWAMWLAMLGVARADDGVATVQPDPRWRWSQYDVGGMVLVNPDNSSMLRLPQGSWLWVPRAGDHGPAPSDTT